MNPLGLQLAALLLTGPAPHLCGEAAVDQLATIRLEAEGILLDVEFDLAEFPAETLLRRLDRNRDRRISRQEQRSWLGRGSRELLNRLRLQVDGKPLALKLLPQTRLELSRPRVGPFPLKFHLQARALLPGGTPSPTRVTFENRAFTSQPGFIRAYLETPAGMVAEPLTELPDDLAHYEELVRQINQATGSADPIPKDRWPPMVRQVSWSLAQEGGDKPALPTGPPATAPPERSEPAGTAEKGGFTSRVNREVDRFFRHWDEGRLDWLFFLIALFYGALHALSPGHGKAITGAFLVGNRGTVRDAFLLGLTVTATHTFAVFALGLAYHLLLNTGLVQGEFRQAVVRFLEILSALLIVAVGAFLAWTQGRSLVASRRGGVFVLRLLLHLVFLATAWLLVVHDADLALLVALATWLTWNLVQRSLPVPAPHHHHHDHGHEAPADHHHDHGHHHHGPGGHSHEVPVDPQTGRPKLWQVLYLGVTGGLVPCPTGLFIIALAMAFNRPLLGLALVAVFSFGMAAVLIGIGIGAVKGFDLVVRYGGQGTARLFFILPLVSALFITALGVLMTYWALTSSSNLSLPS